LLIFHTGNRLTLGSYTGHGYAVPLPLVWSGKVIMNSMEKGSRYGFGSNKMLPHKKKIQIAAPISRRSLAIWIKVVYVSSAARGD